MVCWLLLGVADLLSGTICTLPLPLCLPAAIV